MRKLLEAANKLFEVVYTYGPKEGRQWYTATLHSELDRGRDEEGGFVKYEYEIRVPNISYTLWYTNSDEGYDNLCDWYADGTVEYRVFNKPEDVLVKPHDKHRHYMHFYGSIISDECEFGQIIDDEHEWEFTGDSRDGVLQDMAYTIASYIVDNADALMDKYEKGVIDPRDRHDY